MSDSGNIHRPIMKISKLKKSNALIIYDCCKPHDKTNTQIELLIIFHKDCLIAEVIARQFDQVNDEDFRIYLDYLELYKRIEVLIYAQYETDIAKKADIFLLANPQSALPFELSSIIPFNEYHFDVAKDNIVNFVLERLKVNVKHHQKTEVTSNKPNIRLEFFHNPLGTPNNTMSVLICDQPEGLVKYDIKHHRQNSVGATLFKEMLVEAGLDAPNASPRDSPNQNRVVINTTNTASDGVTLKDILNSSSNPDPYSAQARVPTQSFDSVSSGRVVLPTVVGSGRTDIHRMESDFLRLMQKTHKQGGIGGGLSEKQSGGINVKRKASAQSPPVGEHGSLKQHAPSDNINGVAHLEPAVITGSDSPGSSPLRKPLPLISPRPVFSGRYSSNLSPKDPAQFSHTNFEAVNISPHGDHSPSTNNLLVLPKLNPSEKDSIFVLKNTVNSRPSSSNSNVKLRPLDDTSNTTTNNKTSQTVRRDRSDSEGSSKQQNHVNFNINYGSVKLEAIHSVNSSFLNTSADNVANNTNNNLTVNTKEPLTPADFSHLSSSVKMMTTALLSKTDDVMSSLMGPINHSGSPVDLDGVGHTSALLGVKEDNKVDEVVLTAPGRGAKSPSPQVATQQHQSSKQTPTASAKVLQLTQPTAQSVTNASPSLSPHPTTSQVQNHPRASFDAFSLENIIEQHAHDLLHHSRTLIAGSQDEFDMPGVNSGKGSSKTLFKSEYTPTGSVGPSWGAGITSTRSSISLPEAPEIVQPTGSIITEDIAEKIKHQLEAHHVTGFHQPNLKIEVVSGSAKNNSKSVTTKSYSLPGDDSIVRTPKALYFKAAEKSQASDDSECVTPSKRMAGNNMRSFGDASTSPEGNTITSKDTENLLSSSAKAMQSLAASAANSLHHTSQGNGRSSSVVMSSSLLNNGGGGTAITPTSMSTGGMKVKKTRRRSIGDTPIKNPPPSSFGSNNSQVNPRGGNVDVKEAPDKSKATPKSRRRSYGEEPPSIVPEGLSVRKVKQPAGDGSAQSAAQSTADKLFGVPGGPHIVDDYSPVSRMGIIQK